MFKGPLSPYMDFDWFYLSFSWHWCWLGGLMGGVCGVATGLQCVCGVGLFPWSLGHLVMVEDRLYA